MANDRSDGDRAEQGSEAERETAPGIRVERPRDAGGGHPRSGAGLRLAPFLELTVYYALLITVGSVLAAFFPAVREAFLSPVSIPAVGGAEDILTGRAPAVTPEIGSLHEVLGRARTTLLVILGALALIVPVARVYMQTKRLRYDPALVQSVVILPIVVAGIALVVKDSIALAFALAGIVAAVRFRNTLKDPRDAVYIFLVIGIGLSAGVQALDVALIISMIFNYVVLILWRFNIGSIYSGRFAQTGVISAGETKAMMAGTPERRRRIRHALLEDAEDMGKVDGVLLVHSSDPQMVRHTAQEAFAEYAKEWRLVRIVPRTGGSESLHYLVKLKKKATPAELVGALAERWGAHVTAAEYFWFRARSSKRSTEESKADDDE